MFKNRALADLYNNNTDDNVDGSVENGSVGSADRGSGGSVDRGSTGSDGGTSSVGEVDVIVGASVTQHTGDVLHTITTPLHPVSNTNNTSHTVHTTNTNTNNKHDVQSLHTPLLTSQQIEVLHARLAALRTTVEAEVEEVKVVFM